MCCVSRTVLSSTPGASASEPSRAAGSRSGCSPRQRGTRVDRGWPLVPRSGEPVEGVGTLGTHPALFLYDPRPLWRALGEEWDVLDLHEEPFALATAEVLLLRALRGRRMPYLVYSAQNLDKRLPAPFRWLQRRVLDGAAAVSVCSTAAGEIVRRRGFPGRPDVVPLGGRVAARRRRGELPARGRTIGYAGRLADHKGVDVLLEAVAGLSDTELVVAGAGPAQVALHDRASRSDLAGRVRFLGSLHGEALAGVLPGPRRSRGALAHDRRVGRAVRPGRGRGHGLRRAGRRQRQWRSARRRR